MAQADVSPLLSKKEHQRLDKVISLIPKDANSILEIGARHGAMTRRLAEIVEHVTALDLEKPSFEMPRVDVVKGDVQRLQFPDNSFDCIICTEVLEHVPDFQAAASEICRVARSYILIGVPYRQDTRVGRTTCVHCGRINPPYGHVNRFDEKRLETLFRGAELIRLEFLSENRERTNAISTWLQDFAGNPYGTYEQEEGCIHCGGRMVQPGRRPLLRRAAGALGLRLYNMQYVFNRPRPTWMLALLRKRQG